jgi:prophage DNA circulation protein
MAISTFGEPWRARLQPASFNGAGFYVEADVKAGGRRNVRHEFPKRDTPYTEDMGRRVRRFVITGYVIQNRSNGFDYTVPRDALIAALETEGPGLLIHPTLGQDLVVQDTYQVTERQERGGMAEFEMTFYEAGAQTNSMSSVDTASAASAAASSAATSFQGSNDIVDAFGSTD